MPDTLKEHMPQQPPQSPEPARNAEHVRNRGARPGNTPPHAGWAAPSAPPSRAGATPPPGPGPVPPGSGTGPVPGGPGYGPVRGYGPGQPTRAYGASTAGSPVASGASTVVAEAPKKDLTINKVIAGAGAASASAVLGSFFGAMGTVTGAAIGSVFSAIITAAMEKSLDKTRDTVKARVKLPSGRTVDVTGKTEVPVPPTTPGGETGTARVFVTPGDQTATMDPGDRPTELIAAVPAADDAGPARPRSRRRLVVMAAFTVVVFAIGMLAITGIELVKGSPLNTGSSSGTGGTSLGSVIGGDTGATTTETTEEDAPGSGDESSVPADEDGASAESTAEEDPGQSEGNSTEGDEESTPTRATPIPTPDVGSDAGGASPNESGGGGAAEIPAQQ